ncbi:MAG TPA: LysR family transcriptional regulator [Candidatus Binatia bacterium]
MANYPHIGLRVFLGPDSVLCSTKAGLLQSISETGSIAAAGRRMGMSYKRAWYLIDTLNAYFNEPVVVSSKGGPKGGGASLTNTGEQVLACYLGLQRKSEAAASADLKQLASLSGPSRAQKAI